MDGYKKIKLLGRGTYGSVYLCGRKQSSNKIVLKEINKHLSDSGVQAANNEIKILKSLNHPNIIEYQKHFISKTFFYIVMEYAMKGNLYQLISRYRHSSAFIPQKTLLNIFGQILLGLNHIHLKQIIHRDLKCENILITGSKYDLIKIADFGISKLLESSDETNTVIGTPNYLAPEICDGKSYGIKSDIWSLGCILYELCALERMFEGSISNVVLSIARGEIKQINTNIYNKNVQEIINICLVVNPSFRPTTTDLINSPTLLPVILHLMVDLGRIECTDVKELKKDK